MTSCRELIQESYSRLLEAQGFMKQELGIKEESHVGENTMYQRGMVKVLKKVIDMCKE